MAMGEPVGSLSRKAEIAARGEADELRRAQSNFDGILLSLRLDLLPQLQNPRPTHFALILDRISQASHCS
jgi:hypothetical protein